MASTLVLFAHRRRTNRKSMLLSVVAYCLRKTNQSRFGPYHDPLFSKKAIFELSGTIACVSFL